MLNKSLAIVLALLLLSCTTPSRNEEPVVSSPYTMDIQVVWDIDTSLVGKFNKYFVDETVPRVAEFKVGRSFPQIFPGLILLSTRFAEGEKPQAMSFCYDTLNGRFYQIIDGTFETDFNEIIGERFEDGISEEQAFWIAACAVFMKDHPKMIICRAADLFLEPRLRDYMNETYTPSPGRPQKEFSNLWWGWVAFPSANNDYRGIYSVYQDSIMNNDFLQDIPDGTFGVPTVEKDGIYYVVTFFGLPGGASGEVHRYRLRIASDGRLHSTSTEVVFYY
jgi:hypothetical protein